MLCNYKTKIKLKVAFKFSTINKKIYFLVILKKKVINGYAERGCAMAEVCSMPDFVRTYYCCDKDFCNKSESIKKTSLLQMLCFILWSTTAFNFNIFL